MQGPILPGKCAPLENDTQSIADAKYSDFSLVWFLGPWVSRISPAPSLYTDHQQSLLKNPKPLQQIFPYDCRREDPHQGHSGLQPPSSPPWCSTEPDPRSGQFLPTPQYPHCQPQRCHTNLAFPVWTFHPLHVSSQFTHTRADTIPQASSMKSLSSTQLPPANLL